MGSNWNEGKKNPKREAERRRNEKLGQFDGFCHGMAETSDEVPWYLK